MHDRLRPSLLAILLIVAALAGCAGRGEQASGMQGDITPTPDDEPSTAPAARFQVADLAILAADGKARPLFEDDTAIVRYAVRQPAEAGKAESAFVTYLLNGRILDVQQLTLGPGEERRYERNVTDLWGARPIVVEVRAGAANARAELPVDAWPRAGDAPLTVGPMLVRADYGLLEQEGRTLVNLSLTRDMSEQRFEDFRVKLLCLEDNRTIVENGSVRVEAPTPGNETRVDVSLTDCAQGRYGLEFKANHGADELRGRLLLVPHDWRPLEA